MISDPIETAASKLAHLSKRWNPGIEYHVEDIRYGVARSLSFYLIIFFCLIIGLTTGKFFETVLSMISFIMLRRFTGGFHMPTLTSCLVVSVALLSGIPHIQPSGYLSQLFNFISVALVLIFSQRRKTENMIGATMMIVANIIFNNDVIAMSFLAQGILLIKIRR